MKRSKMINKLALLLYDKDVDSGFMSEDNWYDFAEDYRNDAEIILDKLELWGMAPPSYAKYDINNWHVLSGNNSVYDLKNTIVNEWEPESPSLQEAGEEK